MSNLEEKQISREEIFCGVALHVVKDEILLPNGHTGIREISLQSGAAAVIPVLSDGRVIMERQYRYAHHRVMLEIPAGKFDSPDEDPIEAAKRELREETGATAKKITPLGTIATAPALIDEVIHLFMAQDISFGERDLDPDEFLDIEFIHIDKLYEMVMNGEISDSKTQIAILKAREILKQQ
jgi:ADP-ribose pyrophosphatase